MNTAGYSRITAFVSNQNNNILQNPSLEQGTSNPPSCWLLGGFGTNTVHLDVDSGRPHGHPRREPQHQRLDER